MVEVDPLSDSESEEDFPPVLLHVRELDRKVKDLSRKLNTLSLISSWILAKFGQEKTFPSDLRCNLLELLEEEDSEQDHDYPPSPNYQSQPDSEPGPPAQTSEVNTDTVGTNFIIMHEQQDVKLDPLRIPEPEADAEGASCSLPSKSDLLEKELIENNLIKASYVKLVKLKFKGNDIIPIPEPQNDISPALKPLPQNDISPTPIPEPIPKEIPMTTTIEPKPKDLPITIIQQSNKHLLMLNPYARSTQALLNRQKFPCAHCDKVFQRRAHLNIHMRIHTGDKPFACDICGKRFAQRGNLPAHIRTHTGERPYVCEFCNKSFAKSSNLLSHRRFVHFPSLKPFACDICGEKFGYQNKLREHREKKHPNSDCDASPVAENSVVLA